MAEDPATSTVSSMTCSRSCVTVVAAIVASAIASCILGTGMCYICARVKARERERKRDDVERARLAQAIREILSRNWSRSINGLDEEESVTEVQLPQSQI